MDIQEGEGPENSPLSQDLKCPICYETSPNNIEIGECQHFFCLKCLQAYLHFKISESKVIQLSCPGNMCSNVLTRVFIEQVVSPEYLIKYDKFRKREELSSNPFLRYCPKPDCEGYDIGGNGKLKLTCCQCDQLFCFACNEIWHPKSKCKNQLNIQFENWAKRSNVKFCPNCKKRVEKNGGCNHMTCICGNN